MTALEQSKSELLTRLCAYAESKGAKAPDGVDLAAVLKAFYRHVAPEDLLERDAADLYGAVMAQLRLAAERPQGTAAVRVFTPSVSVNGWSAGGHTVVEVVTDDMPFLVDSVSMALAEAQHDIHLVIHPQFVVRRDLVGQLLEVLDEHAETDPHDVSRESWMHLEIDRVSDDQLGEIHGAAAPRCSPTSATPSRTGRGCTPRSTGSSRTSRSTRRRCPADELEQGAALLRWLGRQPLHLPRLPRVRPRGARATTRPWSPCPAPASASCAPTRRRRACCPRRSPRAPATSTCSCSPRPTRKATVHRPVYLDYVGVKKFDENGEVVGERRFLGLFSSAAYTESVRRIPVLREKAARSSTSSASTR